MVCEWGEGGVVSVTERKEERKKERKEGRKKGRKKERKKEKTVLQAEV